MNVQIALSNHLFCEGLKKLINEGDVDTVLNQRCDNLPTFKAEAA
jgi:hypothetical protein